MSEQETEFENIIQMLRQKGLDSWEGKTGEDRADNVETCVRRVCASYADKLGYSPLEILQSIEKRRNYCAVNYYQDSKFPDLYDVHIFETQEDLQKSCASKEFRCPACNQISKNPYECNSGFKSDDGKVCDWKSYGLFGTLGKGFNFTIKDTFLEHGSVENIFMPVEFEEVKP